MNHFNPKKAAGRSVAALLSAAMSLTMAVSPLYADEGAMMGTPDTGNGTSLPDEKPDLGDSFYYNVNWDQLSNVQEDELLNGAFDYLTSVTLKVLDDVGVLVTQAVEAGDQGSEDQQNIANFYNTYMDFQKRVEVGYEPFNERFAPVEQAQTIDEFMKGLAQTEYIAGIKAPVLPVDPEIDVYDNTKMVVNLLSPGYGLEDAIWLNPNYADAIETVIERLLQVMGYSEQEAAAFGPDLYALLKEIFDNTTDSADPEIFYNEYSMEELEQLYSNIDISAYLEEVGFDENTSFIVNDPKSSELINSYLTEENLPLLKVYAKFVDLYSLQAAWPINVAQTQEILEGEPVVKTMSADQQALIASQTVSDTYAWQIGKLYVDEFYDQSATARITDLAYEIIDSYKELIAAQDWMADSTKANAIQKLDTMTVEVGYPEDWDLYTTPLSSVSVEDGGDFLTNYLDAQQMTRQFTLEKYYTYRDNAPIELGSWPYPPQKVNAAYGPQINGLIVFAGFVNYPFYSSDYTPEQLLGTMGVVIGHEISHGFDSQGALYDSFGNYNLWWTSEDMARYEEQCQRIIEYYDNFQVAGISVDGELTLAENIADLGALTVVTMIADAQGYDLAEVYTSYARMWAGIYETNTLLNQTLTDVHSPLPARVDAVLASIDRFYDVFNISEDDGMYVAPADRVGIWVFPDNPGDPEDVDNFVDVSTSDWFASYVAEAVNKGIMIGWTNAEGYDEFGPYQVLSRAQAATVLYRYANPDWAENAVETNQTTWLDVEDGAWYTDAMNWAYENDIFNGYDQTSVGPDDPITREQLCQILYNYAANIKKIEIVGATPDSYADASDKESVSQWAQDAVGWAFYNKIMTGNQPGNVLDAADSVVRASAAKMFVVAFGNVMGWN